MSIVRVKADVQSVVQDPTTGEMLSLRPGDEFDHTDAVVKSFPWAFQSDADAKANKRTRSVRIEQATATPGEMR